MVSPAQPRSGAMRQLRGYTSGTPLSSEFPAQMWMGRSVGGPDSRTVSGTLPGHSGHLAWWRFLTAA